MRKILFLLLIPLMLLVSCSKIKEVGLPNKKIKVDNGKVYYKNELFTGKVKVGRKGQYNGFASFTDGELSGETDIKGKAMNIKFTVENGKLQDEFLLKNEEDNINMILNYENGKIVKIVGSFSRDENYDLTFTDGLADGWFENGEDRFEFQDGITSYINEGVRLDIKYYINQETGDMGMEFFVAGESVAKNEIKNTMFSMDYVKLMILSIISESNF